MSFFASHHEPKRKSNMYPGGRLPDDHVGTGRIAGYGEKVLVSDGKDALQKSLRYAMGGIEHTNELKCLHGPLRKAAIQLARNIRAWDNINLLARDRERRRARAWSKFCETIQGYDVVAKQRSDGRIIWRLKKSRGDSSTIVMFGPPA